MYYTFVCVHVVQFNNSCHSIQHNHVHVMQLCAELNTVRGGNRHTHHVPIQSVCMCTDVVCVGWGVWLLMWSVWGGGCGY